jgi:hypothetical protein
MRIRESWSVPLLTSSRSGKGVECDRFEAFAVELNRSYSSSKDFAP